MGTVLILEDEPLLAMHFGQIIEELDHEFVRLSTSLSEAESQMHTDVDFALLNVRVGQDTSFTLARRLLSAGIPFAFVSACHRSEIPDDLRSARFISKPCLVSELVATVRSGLEGVVPPGLSPLPGACRVP